MRRVLPILLTGVIALAACSGDDDSNSIADITLVDIGSTEVPIDDACATTEAGSTVPSGSEAPAGSEVAGTDTTGSAPAGSEELPGSSAPASSVPGSSVPGSSVPGSSVPGSSAPAASTAPDGTAVDTTGVDGSGVDTTGVEDTGVDGTGVEGTGVDGTGVDGTGVDTTGVDGSDVVGTEAPYSVAPEVELPEETPTELEVIVLEEGPEAGPRATTGSVVLVYYSGMLSSDGTVFDGNYGSGQPLQVLLGYGGVIDGWDQGLVGVKPGDRIQLNIPSDLAYGDVSAANGAIPPDSALTFVIDVADVIPVEWPTEAPTELERRVVTEGPDDGREAQRFDTVSMRYLFGLPGVTAEVPTSTTPEGSAPDTTEVTDTTEATDTTTSAGTTEPSSTGTDVVSSGPAASSEPSDDTAVAASSEPEAPAVTPTVIDENFTQPDPLPLPLNGATGIAGLEQGLLGAKPGDVIQLDIPSDLAFGEFGTQDGSIPPGATVTFYIAVDDVTGPPVIDVPDEVPTELESTVLTEGSGPEAEVGDTVFVNYVAALTETNERVLSTWNAIPQPILLGDDTVIEGWEEGLVGVQTGEELQLDVPADLAYGNDSFPAESVPSGSAMSFVINVAAVVPATTEDEAPAIDDLPLSTTPATDIITDDVIEGEGTELTTGMTAVVNVLAVCATNGAVLQNTWGDDQREFIDTTNTSAILPGLLTGILDMQVGGRRVITLPAEMAYADQGNRELGIGPDRDLIYVVDLYAAIGVPPTDA